MFAWALSISVHQDFVALVGLALDVSTQCVPGHGPRRICNCLACGAAGARRLARRCAHIEMLCELAIGVCINSARPTGTPAGPGGAPARGYITLQVKLVRRSIADHVSDSHVRHSNWLPTLVIYLILKRPGHSAA